MSSTYSPSKQLKRLYAARKIYASEAGIEVSLKDFAIDLANNGSKEQALLARAWLKNKSADGKE